MNNLEIKITRFKKNIETFNNIIIAFSGGKDSLFLTLMALEVSGKNNVTIVFVDSEFISENDKKRVDYFEKKFNLDIKRISIDVLSNASIKNNSKDRCYICKKKIFNSIINSFGNKKNTTILDGTTFSDIDQFRPGLAALQELDIVSPLKDAKITSDEIIKLLKQKNIDRYYLTSSTCLATRFPYNHNLSITEINNFEKIELFLVEHDVFPVRVRYIVDGIRIEAEENLTPKILNIKDALIKNAKKGGFKFITLDLEGIKSGVWD